jgi:putative transcription factor
MASCELCGQETDSRKKVKIEGAKLNVCDSCADMGDQVKTSSKKRKTKKKKKKSRTRSTTPSENKVLVNGYGKEVKKARESKDMSLKDLANKMNEKQSQISKIEKEKLKPGEKLAKKLKKQLGVDLYTNAEVANYDQTDDADGRKATLGDVAKVKED